ncbi:hypothetical protein DF286_06440 [Sphingosinicella humi]|uniref:Uncharacterized protein n=1 Tax=Allosphingosinicella humi TaxID=2068657 RepID=A0A2U2J2K9_9SPHN|nr:hypothetical protein DF286_06440 [Sphingosinicella humi]
MRAERSNPAPPQLDCFVAFAPRNDGWCGAAAASVRPERSRGASAPTHHTRPSTSLGTND